MDIPRQGYPGASFKGIVKPAPAQDGSVAQRKERSEPDKGRKDAGSTPVAVAQLVERLQRAADSTRDPVTQLDLREIISLLGGSKLPDEKPMEEQIMLAAARAAIHNVFIP